MIETKEREIGGHTISVTQLPAKRAMKLLRRVLKVLAPALGDAAGPALAATKAEGIRGLAGMDLSNLGGALQRLFEQLDDASLDAIVFDRDGGALATARIDGRELLPVLDAVIGANLLLLGKIVAFALEVHFGSFFDGLRAGSEPEKESA